MGIKKNFIFSSVLTASNYIFPFIVYPYVARVLGVNNIGIVNFVDGIINYAILFSMLGISIVGIRETAKAKNNRAHLDATFTSLFSLCAVFTLVSGAVLIALTFTVEQLAPFKKLLFIGLLKLFSNFLLIEWFYKGVEDFKFITFRTILVKIGYLVSVFVFVHNPSDYVVYYLLMCLMVTVNAVINCYRAFQSIRLKFDWQITRRMVKPIFTLGLYLLLNSMYTTFNVIYLGFVQGDVQVGYYSTAVKIFNIILAFYTAYSGVVMPRISALLSENKIEEYRSIIRMSIQGLLMFAVPAVLFTVLFSPGIIYLIAGPSYSGAIFPMMIVMPLIFIIGYEQILVVQILTPSSSDRIILFNSVVGASVGIIGNIVLVGGMGAIGSSIVWVMAEVAVLLSAQYFVTIRYGFRFPMVDLLKNIAAYIPYVVISVAVIRYLPANDIVKMGVGAVACALYFVFAQRMMLRNEIFIKNYYSLVSKLVRHNR